MNILHVNKFFDERGGAEAYLHRLMAAQSAAGHEVHIFSTRSSENLPSQDEPYFVERFDLDRHEGCWRAWKKTTHFLWNREAKQGIERMIREIRPDVIHLHNVYHHLSSSILKPIRRAGLPCVQTLHDYKLANPNYAMFSRGAICEHGKGGRYWQTVWYGCLPYGFFANVLAMAEMYLTKTRRVYERTVDYFLCPSEFMRQKMIEWGEPAEQLLRFPYAVDLPETPAGRGGGYVLYAGRLSPEKGLESLILAAARVPELPVKIAGRGPEEARLRRLAKEQRADHVEFLGFVKPDELRLIRRKAEAMILPTLSYENLSVALLEAMADGLPCLATRRGGNPELVEDGVNGFLVAPGSAEDWESLLRRFLAVPEDVRAKMAQESRQKIAREFLWPAHLKRLEDVYREAGVKKD